MASNMDHDGPKTTPFYNKRATAAEQVSHLQDEYEARAKPSEDKVKAVESHNDKHPKLREPLHRRQSVADVTDVSKRHLAMANDSKTTKKSRKHRARREKLSRVTKKRRNCTCSKCLPALLSNTKSCQITSYILVVNKRIGTDRKKPDARADAPVVFRSKTKVGSITKVGPITKIGSGTNVDEKDDKSTGSKVDSRSSPTPSIVTIYSNYSTDHEHEPMV